MKRSATILATGIMALLLSVAASSEDDGRQKPAGPPTDKLVRCWIEELDSDSFTARETATRRLIETGRAAVAPVADAALPHLKKLTKLQKLYVAGTNITDAGVVELKQALPGCRVVH